MAQKDIKVEFVTKERAKEACHVLVESFIKANGIYKKNDASYNDVYPIFEYELEQSILDKFAIALTLNGKIIAVSLNHDMHDYPKLQNIPWAESQAKFIVFERKYVQDIENYLFNSNYERGVAVYSNYAAILPEFISMGGVGRKLFIEVKNEHRKRGYKIVYCTATTDRVLRFATRLGGKVVRERKCLDPGMEGETYALIKGEYIYRNKPAAKQEEIKPKL